jgi:hypothetical protein
MDVKDIPHVLQSVFGGIATSYPANSRSSNLPGLPQTDDFEIG